LKVTKFVHSCLLVEMPAPVNRTALFDPGMMSEAALDVESLQWLDDIIITHNHPDHLSVALIKKLVAKFPDVRITTTPQAVEQLANEGIKASSQPTDGLVFFDSPHESVAPLFPQPENIGMDYLDLLTDPGDSHTFTETKAVLALPIQAPWGSTVKAVNLAIQLKPKYILPIHDWHWNDDARTQTYDALEKLFNEQNITFCKLATGTPVVLDI
jgi:L-ascorbate metabolism protein UlaG (beta-lactamase superfamily)